MVFSKKAEKYAKYRWDYAAGAIEAIVNITHMSASTTVADIGAGTGILTRHFLTTAGKVYAVEPNFELRQILTRELGNFPSVSIMNGSAEDTRLPDHSVDAITVAQAIHWFDPEPAGREMMRILKNGGWLVLIRNYGTNQEKYEAVKSLWKEEYGANPSVVNVRPQEKPSGFYFGENKYQAFCFPFSFQQDWEEFLGALTTISFMPDDDHPLFPKLESEAKKLFSRYSKDGYWTVEGETELIIGQPSNLTGNAS